MPLIFVLTFGVSHLHVSVHLTSHIADILNLRHSLEVNGQLHAPAALLPRRGTPVSTE